MKFPAISNIWEKVYFLGPILLMLAFLTGCKEVNVAVDGILGRTVTPAIAAGLESSPTKLMLAKKREPGGGPPVEEQVGPGLQPETEAVKPAAKPGTPETETSPASPKASEVIPRLTQGKKRPPGALSPSEEAAKAQQELAVKESFTIERDPFKAPTEILPSECPPSMPLCRFDRSQLKLRGVIQLADGQFKGMVEDPDGRGYFVIPGMQIGGATVTQITNKGVTLFLHKTRQDVLMPLFVEAKEGKEF